MIENPIMTPQQATEAQFSATRDFIDGVLAKFGDNPSPSQLSAYARRMVETGKAELKRAKRDRKRAYVDSGGTHHPQAAVNRARLRLRSFKLFAKPSSQQELMKMMAEEVSEPSDSIVTDAELETLSQQCCSILTRLYNEATEQMEGRADLHSLDVTAMSAEDVCEVLTMLDEAWVKAALEAIRVPPQRMFPNRDTDDIVTRLLEPSSPVRQLLEQYNAVMTIGHVQQIVPAAAEPATRPIDQMPPSERGAREYLAKMFSAS